MEITRSDKIACLNKAADIVIATVSASQAKLGEDWHMNLSLQVFRL